MSIVIIGGHDRMVRQYETICKKHNCKAKIFTQMPSCLNKKIGNPDLVVLTGGNFDELKEHICSRLFVLPNETIVYPGHGAPTTIGIEKAENPFFR